MARDVTIKISATDAASPVFKTIGQNANQMGASVEQSAQKSARSFEDMQRKGMAVGAALGTVVGAMSAAGQAAAQQQQQIDGIRRVYGESADEILRFSKELQDATNFSDEQARQAALTASTLQRSYGLTTEATEQLIARSADLAQVYGMDLADAVQRTSAALRGEGESAEALGLTLSDSAVAAEAAARGLDGWNTSMSESEKAAFRFTLLMEQSADVTGAAGDAAEGARGKMIDLQQGFQDATVAVGQFLGPAGEALSVLGSLALIAPVAGGVFGKIFGGIGGAAAAGGGGGGTVAALTGLATALGSVAAMAAIAAPGILAVGYAAYTATDHLKAVREETEKMNEALAATGGAQNENLTRVYQLFRDYDAIIEANVGQGTETLDSTMDELYALRGVYAETFADFANMTIDWSKPIREQEAAVRDLIVRVHELADAQWAATWLPFDQARAAERSGVGYNTTPTTAGQASGGQYYADTTGTSYNGPLQPSYATGTEMAGRGANLTPFIPGGEIQWTDQVQGLQDYRDALREGRVELELLNGAQMSAGDAQLSFRVTQDILIEQQGEYTGQLSEYETQLGYINDAVDLLNKRKEEGIAISEEEQAFLDAAPAAQERLQGGAEDATLALGAQAVQMAENMKIGDQMNDNLENTNTLLGLLIELLGGVPPETEAHINNNAVELTPEVVELSTALGDVPPETYAQILGNVFAASEMAGGVFNLKGALDLLNGTTATAYVNVVQVGGANVDVNPFAMHGITAYANGGTAYDPLMPRFANGGTWAMVGEVGPELVKLSRGDQVIPTGASRTMLGKGGGGGNIHVANVYVYPATADVQREFTAALVGDWRQ